VARQKESKIISPKKNTKAEVSNTPAFFEPYLSVQCQILFLFVAKSL
jgi:hypothetical protein